MIVGGSWIGFVAEPFEPEREPEPVPVVDGVTARVVPLVERFGAGVNVAVPVCWPVWHELVHLEPFPFAPPLPLFEPPRPLDPVLCEDDPPP
jgi:hypothetical protein